MTQQGIYVAPCDNRPNRDRTQESNATKEQRLWSIKFEVANIGNGVAVAKAYNPKEAESILKSEGVYNGSPSLYKILLIEEIIPSPAPMLISEQIVEI